VHSVVALGSKTPRSFTNANLVFYELLDLNKQIDSVQADLEADDSDDSSFDETPSLG